MTRGLGGLEGERRRRGEADSEAVTHSPESRTQVFPAALPAFAKGEREMQRLSLLLLNRSLKMISDLCCWGPGLDGGCGVDGP